MNLSNIMSNIIIGAIGSILATVLLFLGSKFYQIGYKERFQFDLESARAAVFQIENQHLFPEDYLLVITQIDVLRQCAINMYCSLSPLSMITKKKSKKLITTLLHDIIRVCEYSKYITVGYDGMREKKARLDKIHRAFYKYTPTSMNHSSTVKIQLDVIQNIIDGKNLKESIIQSIDGQAEVFFVENLLSDKFIDINSFRPEAHKRQNNKKSIKIKNSIREKCFYWDEFDWLLKKIQK